MANSAVLTWRRAPKTCAASTAHQGSKSTLSVGPSAPILLVYGLHDHAHQRHQHGRNHQLLIKRDSTPTHLHVRDPKMPRRTVSTRALAARDPHWPAPPPPRRRWLHCRRRSPWRARTPRAAAAPRRACRRGCAARPAELLAMSREFWSNLYMIRGRRGALGCLVRPLPAPVQHLRIARESTVRAL